jgi:hypothetical protein
VFALEAGNPNNRVNGFNVVILSPNLLSVDFNFTTANAGKTFLIFVSGPNGTSRNLTTAVNGCLGNELGIQVTFTCNALTAPGGSGTPAGVAVVTGCRIERDDVGTNFLIISGQNFESGAAVTVGSKKPKKVKFQDVAAGSNTFTTLRAKGKFCGGLPGDIVVTNPGKQGSAPFSCNQVCQ